MIEIAPNISISKVVNLLKSYTTYHIWNKHHKYLIKHFWKEKTFYTDGYFVSSVGNVSKKHFKKIYWESGLGGNKYVKSL